jgi:hypothetical protein
MEHMGISERPYVFGPQQILQHSEKAPLGRKARLATEGAEEGFGEKTDFPAILFVDLRCISKNLERTPATETQVPESCLE